MNLDTLTQILADDFLRPMGVAKGRILLLGALEPGFWNNFTKSPEWNDGEDDPMDRWSARVIGAVAAKVSATAHFPFGPDAAPFLAWAMESDTAWQSPVGMLVHNNAGLMVSYRGALEFDAPLIQADVISPCSSCSAPCVTACPVGALTNAGYDIPRCHAYLKTEAGRDCMNAGCLVRRTCPVSQTYARNPDQSGYHMRRFLK